MSKRASERTDGVASISRHGGVVAIVTPVCWSVYEPSSGRIPPPCAGTGGIRLHHGRAFTDLVDVDDADDDDNDDDLEYQKMRASLGCPAE